MSFLVPWAFLLLLTAPILVLLYFLKLKRPNIRVASTLLWQKVIEDMRVNSPFQKLKRSLLLLLQLLILLAVIFALARPLVRMRPTTDESLIALIDVSASMSAVEEGGLTRLETARRELLDFVGNMSRGDELMVIAFGDRANVVCGFTSNRRKLRAAIESVRPTEGRTHVEPALRLATSACHTRSKPRVLLFSDGAFPTPRAIEMPVEIEYQSVGTARPNLAITGLDIRRSPNDPIAIDMFVSIENFSDTPFAGNMLVRLDGAELDSKYFSVAARETLSQVFKASLPAGGDIEVDFAADDALPVDNRASRVILPPAKQRVLIVGKDTYFIERVLRASPRTTCVAIEASEYVQGGADGFATVIWSSVEKPDIAPGNNIYFNCLPEAPGFKRGGEIKSPRILDWDTTHAVTRFLDFDNLVISACHVMECPESSVPVLRGKQTPLVVTGRIGHSEVCLVGFDPMASNWPLLVSFPLFLNNCLAHFEELRQHRVRANIDVGQPLVVAAGGAKPTVRLPDGGVRPFRRGASGDYVFADTTQRGIYRITRAEGRERSVAAELFDRRESDLAPVPEPDMGANKVATLQLNRQVNREYWKWLLGVAALVLAVEWCVYHRRWSV